jgi:hypothetical protein
LYTLPLDLTDPENPKPGKPEVFLKTPFNEMMPMFSPDGRWMAYTSDESGATEVYVRPFPGPGGKMDDFRGRWKFSALVAQRASTFLPHSHRPIHGGEVRGGSFAASRPRPFAANRHMITGLQGGLFRHRSGRQTHRGDALG